MYVSVVCVCRCSDQCKCPDPCSDQCSDAQISADDQISVCVPSRLECRCKRWCQVTVINLILKVDFLVLTLGRRDEDLRRALGRS
jgi:hypothetical protein